MSTIFSAVANHPFEPGVTITADTVGIKHTTADEWAVKLRGQSLINGVEARLKYKVKSAGAGAGSVTVEIRAEGGGGVLAAQAVEVATGAEVTGLLDVEVGGIGGATPIKLVAEVTAADAGETLEVWGQLETATPVIVAGC